MSSKFILHYSFVLQLKTLVAYTPTVFNSIYRITIILSLCINWYLYSTMTKLYLLVYTGNQRNYLNVYSIQTCNLFLYTNATGSCFCFYFINVKNFHHTEGTKSKTEIKHKCKHEQKEQKLGQQEHHKTNKSKTRTEINCNDVLRDQTTYSSTALQ